MGMSTHLYAIIGDRIVSVHRRVVPNYNLLDLRFGEVLYELRVDGEIADSHRHGALGGGGSMFATIEEEGTKISVRVDVRQGLFGTKFKLLVNEAETPLRKSSDAEIKELWHKKSLR